MTRPEVTGRKTGRRLLDYKALKERGIPWTRIHLARLEAAGKFPLHIEVGERFDRLVRGRDRRFPRS